MAKIELDGIDLTFRVRKQQTRMTLKEYLVRGLFFRSTASFMEVLALRDVTLSIAAGERLGIIGHNGAGNEHAPETPGRHLRAYPGAAAGSRPHQFALRSHAQIRARGERLGQHLVTAVTCREKRREASTGKWGRSPSFPNWAILPQHAGAVLLGRECSCDSPLPSRRPSIRRSCSSTKCWASATWPFRKRPA